MIEQNILSSDVRDYTIMNMIITVVENGRGKICEGKHMSQESQSVTRHDLMSSSIRWFFIIRLESNRGATITI